MLSLYVDGEAWRAQLRDFAGTHPGLVPVAKGNGYGFGLHRLARKAQWLGVRTVAVGTYSEIEEVSTRFDGDILVLTPWRPPTGSGAECGHEDDPRVVHTVSRLSDLRSLARTGYRPRVVLELVTSMLRHGMTHDQLAQAQTELDGVRLEGITIHLPLTRADNTGEAERLLTEIVATGLPTRTLLVSHLTDDGLRQLQSRWADFTIRPRIGTALWLGPMTALSPRATVLDVHPVKRGDVYGYRGRSAPRDGHILVVAGGTSHGIGMDAPSAAQSIRARASTLAKAGIEVTGLARSPYVINGRHRLFAEPPHMQASMLFVTGSRIPAVGDEVEVAVRYTTTLFDRVVVS